MARQGSSGSLERVLRRTKSEFDRVREHNAYLDSTPHATPFDLLHPAAMSTIDMIQTTSVDATEITADNPSSQAESVVPVANDNAAAIGSTVTATEQMSRKDVEVYVDVLLMTIDPFNE